MSKDFSFKRFFRPEKSISKITTGEILVKKRQGSIVWHSSRQGTYVRAIHGELK